MSQHTPKQALGRTDALLEKDAAQEALRQAQPHPGAPIPETEPQPGKKKKKRRVLSAVVSLLMCAGTAAAGVVAAPQLTGIRYTSLPNYAFVNGEVLTLDSAREEAHQELIDTLAPWQDRFLPGVFIDGIDLTGKTLPEARAALEAMHSGDHQTFSLKVTVGENTWQLDSGMVPLTRDTEDMLTKAFALSRTLESASLREGSSLEARAEALAALDGQPVRYETTLTWDEEAIRGLCERMAAAACTDPVNAQVLSFDVASRTFAFSEDQPGSYVSGDEVFAAVKEKLDAGDYFASVDVPVEIIFAPVSRSELAACFGKISGCTTETTKDANRNTNIRLSAEAINGKMVAPGETFSFNQATGQRTAAKGYKEATAISGGQTNPEVGGGVCQTSSTLFNAVAMANLEIVSRSPHAWPSSYIDKGLDATVNWPGLDFKFRNDTEWPVFIVAAYGNRMVTVDIYGHSLGDGVKISLTSQVVQTLDAPSGVATEFDPTLPFGTKKTIVKKRKGYVVETYQIWSVNGMETERRLLCTSKYKPYQETVAYNY